MKPIIHFVIALIFLALSITALSASDHIRVVVHPQVIEGEQIAFRWKVLVMLRPKTVMLGTAPVVKVENDAIKVVSIFPEKADISPETWTLFYLDITGSKSTASRKIQISLPDCPDNQVIHVELPIGTSLISHPWEKYYAGKDIGTKDIDRIPDAGQNWSPVSIPRIWEDIGVIWIRTKFQVPRSWKELPLSLKISAVDDKDVTFFNGKEIGRTDGWDTFRSYRVPREIIRFGEENELVIAVDNINAGGGIAKGPIFFGVDESGKNDTLFPVTPLQKESQRNVSGNSPGQIGKARPFRPMVVRGGVLQYADGGEVALWGLNYYPQSWHQYLSLKRSGVDFKTAVDRDFEDFAESRDPADPNRINVIRIHVFDTEISDAEGNLIENDHLDILDYVIHKCHENEVYLWLTPLAWWPSPNQLPESFSTGIPMPAMTLCPETLKCQRNYIRQFLLHKNKYTGRRLVDEPCLGLWEIINEPNYWTLPQLLGEAAPHGNAAVVRKDGALHSDPNAIFRKKVRENWREILPDPSWETSETWDYYQYQTVRRYIDSIIQEIRDVGGRQPVAYHAATWSTSAPIMQAIADSSCDAVTMCMYPGGLRQTPHADALNLLPATADSGWTELFAEKARLVYEFDASDTLRQIDLYPAMARYFRNMGVQVACQFQYDSRFTAALNRDWPTHYLNARHTPERFVSYLIGGQAFRSLPRGTVLESKSETELVFPPAAVSYSKNAALLCDHGLYMQARETDWRPLDISAIPKRIIAVGNTPYYDYAGTGIVDLAINGNVMTIHFSPDVKRHIDDKLVGTPEKPLTTLEENRHYFHLKIPTWEKVTVEIFTNNEWKLISQSTASIAVETGSRYRLTRL